MCAQFSAELYPFCAPLPAAMVEYLFKQYRRDHASSDSVLLDRFLREVQEKQQDIFSRMSHNVPTGQGVEESKKHFNKWFLETVKEESPQKTKIRSKALHNWYNKNLLRNSDEEPYWPAYDSFAALLIARMIDKGLRRWYPPEIRKKEDA